MERFLARAARLLLLLLLIGSVAGCEDQSDTATPRSATSSPAVISKTTDKPSKKLLQESWFALYMGEAKIGHGRTRIISLKRSAEPVISIESEQQFSIHRSGDRVDQIIRTQSLERPDGEVLELHSEVLSGGSAVVTHAVRQGNQLKIALTTQGKTTTTTIKWQPEWRGFDAEQQILRAKLPAPGDVITFSSFLPVFNVVAETRMTVKQWEDVATPFGRERLLRIETRVTTAQGAFDTLLWCDKKGEVHSYSQSNLTAQRTVKDLALAENEVVDLYEALNIKVAKPIPRPQETRRAIYEAHLRNGAAPLQVFRTDHSQRVTLLDKNKARIEVIALNPETESLEEPTSSLPDAADLASNALIQSDDPAVKQLLAEIEGPADDPWRWALACEAFVSRIIENKQLTEAFLTAAEVAETRTGDCTEHAVLTAALCRAHGIPARVATGLVAYQDMFAFHMWNEVWIGDRWMPIDATLGLGGIGAGHIKLNVSNLEGVSPFAALSPVLEVMGALDLAVVSFE